MTSGKEFNKIYDEYYPRIFQYLSRMVGLNDAEDIAQDVFNPDIAPQLLLDQKESTL